MDQTVVNNTHNSRNQTSIQSLLDDLCKSIYKDVNISQETTAHSLYQPSGQQKRDTIPEALLKKCKKRAFEILLKKSNVKSMSINNESSLDGDDSVPFNPVLDLQYSQFEYSIFVGEIRPHFGPYGFVKEREEKKILDKLNLFKECVNFADGNDYFCNEQSDGYSILWFLNLLKNKSGMDTLLTVDSYFPLALDRMPTFPVLQPTYFKLNWQPNMELSENPYCTGMQKLNKRSNQFCLPGLINGMSNEASVYIQSNIVENVLEEVKKRLRSHCIYYESNRWEHRGLRIPLNKDTNPEVIASLYEKKFVTESPNAPLNLMAIAASKRGQRFQARIIDKTLFNEHIKLLLIGVESESFMYIQETGTFHLLENLTTENLPPEMIAHFVRSFIECGICYKNLKSLIHSNNFQLKHNGFVFKALCSTLDRYLETFKSAILIERDEAIGELSVRVSPLIKQIRMLAKLLAVHPDDANRTISYGSEFLGYLYGEIIGVVQQDVYALLVFILSQCCDVYFRRFSNWIYNGIVEDPGQELFIESMNYYLPKTKSYFDKAFVVKQSSVPGFLQGWENSILLCGKYSNLLKMYNPMHPLFTITPPQITVCLSFAQILTVQTECHRYQSLALSKCGRPFQILNSFEQRQKKRLDLVKVIAEKTKQNLEEWKLQQEEKANAKYEKNEKDRLELMQQIEEIRERKLHKRREEVEAERAYLQQCELRELKMIEKENEQRRKNIEYYNELAEIVDAQQKRADAEIDALKSKLSQPKVEKSNDTLVNVDNLGGDDSDTESVYFDANKSMNSSSTSSKIFQSPEILQLSDTAQSPNDTIVPSTGSNEILAKIPRSASDVINSNVIESLAADRVKNRANVLRSNIDLTQTNQNALKVEIPRDNIGPLSEAQKNKMKMFQQEFGFMDANANAQQTTMMPATQSELTELQKNRMKVLSSEFGINEITVNVSTDTRNNNRFDASKEDAVNANKPLTDLQLNRQKVMTQEYGLNTQSQTKSSITNDTYSVRNKLKSSLSLDLDNINEKNSKRLLPKPCHSDFAVSPMSTTSDELMVNSSNELTGDDAEKTQLKLNLSSTVHDEKIEFEQFSAEILERPTPMSALNTAGLQRNTDGFAFTVPYNSQPTFSEILRPTSTSSSIFDISPRLNAARNAKAIPPSPVNQPSKSLTKLELRDLIAGNLAHFLEQSFTIPLKIYSNILNNEILKIFFQDLDVLSHFESLRNYFFMMDGEFASNICDGLLGKLQTVRKPTELLNPYALHSILECAFQSSLLGNDKNAEKLSFCIPNIPEKFDMASPKVLSDLYLSYKVDWPLNLLLSVEAIEHYNKVFQHLFTLRRITWQLDECFYKLKDIRKQSAEMIRTSSQFRDIQQIRHKLLCFVNALQNHITSIAIDGSWQKFQNDLKTVRSMEDLYKKHTKYLKRVKFLCMLNRSSQEFYAKIESIFVLILRFCSKLQSKNWKCENGVYSHPNYEKLKKIEVDFTNLIKFIIYAGNKMSKCGYQTEIGVFIYMININGHYD